jgi:hypothetical protein
VTSDKVLSFNRKQSDVNNLLVEYGKRVNTYVDYQCPTSSAEFYEYQTALSTVYYSLVDSRVCCGIFLKISQGRLESSSE